LKVLTIVGVLLSNAGVSLAEQPLAVDYARDIRPLLAEYCYACHGPDAGQRQADLRFDGRGVATSLLASGVTAIVPGDSGASALVARIFHSNPDERMPPPDEQQLEDEHKLLLQAWVEQGAPYDTHWAFVSPKPPPVPTVKTTSWVRNDVDRFVLAWLEAVGLGPAPEADRITLIRRLSLDLRGFPPGVEEIDAFLADGRVDAYERLVDRYLADEAYGEKMATSWLDLARFGDTNGYQDDETRAMWLYRDYVIDAYNANMPFDQFTIENLAGDLLPEATLDQKIASGFNRNHRFNEEGGSDPEEFLVAYAVDRTNTIATTWLGLTFECSPCHDHKYDPITQKDYYQLYAFFNSVNGAFGVSSDIK